MRIHCVLGLALMLAASSVLGQSNDIGVWYATAQVKDTGDAQGRLSFDNAKGYGVSLNHFWTGSISTELSANWLHANGEIDVAGTRVLSVGRLKLMPVTFDAQWHFMRSGMISPYVGAGVAYVSAKDLTSSDLDLAGVGTVKIDSKSSWNANAGVNIGIGKMFAVAIDGKYIKYEPDSKASGAAGTTEKLKLNPLIVSGGIRLRW